MINKQDFINSYTQDIEMVRGDTLCFNFQLKGLGSIRAYQDLEANFAVADGYDNPHLFDLSKGDGIELEEYSESTDTATFSVNVDPVLTKELELARYYYDLQIKTGTNVITLMRGRFTLVYDVSD